MQNLNIQYLHKMLTAIYKKKKKKKKNLYCQPMTNMFPLYSVFLNSLLGRMGKNVLINLEFEQTCSSFHQLALFKSTYKVFNAQNKTFYIYCITYYLIY